MRGWARACIETVRNIVNFLSAPNIILTENITMKFHMRLVRKTKFFSEVVDINSFEVKRSKLEMIDRIKYK